MSHAAHAFIHSGWCHQSIHIRVLLVTYIKSCISFVQCSCGAGTSKLIYSFFMQLLPSPLLSFNENWIISLDVISFPTKMERVCVGVVIAIEMFACDAVLVLMLHLSFVDDDVCLFVFAPHHSSCVCHILPVKWIFIRIHIWLLLVFSRRCATQQNETERSRAKRTKNNNTNSNNEKKPRVFWCKTWLAHVCEHE